MRTLWQRLPALIGRDLEADRPRGRPFTVVDVLPDAVVIRIQAGARRRGTAREYRISCDELQAVANVDVPGVDIGELDALGLRNYAYAGYALAILRAAGNAGDGTE